MILGRSAFVFANLRDADGGGREPDLPHDTNFMEIAAPDLKARWKLYEVALEPRDPRGWPGVETVSSSLESLLVEARHHPYAVAVARQRLLEHLKGDVPVLVTRETFAHLFAAFLHEAMRTHPGAIQLETEPLDRGD